jgi:hypothetical protein
MQKQPFVKDIRRPFLTAVRLVELPVLLACCTATCLPPFLLPKFVLQVWSLINVTKQEHKEAERVYLYQFNNILQGLLLECLTPEYGPAES